MTNVSVLRKSRMRVVCDSWVMVRRCLRTSLRNPETVGTAIFIPAFMMVLFGLVFGNVMDVGEYNYIDFIVPGILMQTIAQAVSSAAISVNNDMQKGVIDRFRSMAITRSSVLTGHVFAAVARNMLATAVVIGIAFAIGFRPSAGFIDWLLIAGILVLYMLAITWIAVICGLVAKAPESAGTMPFPLFVLPYVSSGFVPVETMPAAFRWFAENQPMTPIIDSLRALMLGQQTGGSLMLAFIWCIGIIVAAFLIAVQIYKRKLS